MLVTYKYGFAAAIGIILLWENYAVRADDFSLLKEFKKDNNFIVLINFATL